MNTNYHLTKTPYLTVDSVVFINGGAVLIKRGVEPFRGWYALPGGFVEIGETVENACVRETKEETGLILDKNKLSVEVEIE